MLQHEQRGVLLNTIAGCYSAQGRSEQAFAYMYQALRDSGPAHGRGYDAVLHCNLAHELLQIGDYHEALRQLDQGISRCQGIHNPRLLAVLLINRVICLTELDRAQEAMLDVMRVRSLPADASGRGALAAHFETLAIAALRAGEPALGDELVQRAMDAPRESIPDELVDLADKYLHKNAETADALLKRILQSERERKEIAGIKKLANERAKKANIHNKKLRDCKQHLGDLK